jgi:hypothetical protein
MVGGGVSKVSSARTTAPEGGPRACCSFQATSWGRYHWCGQSMVGGPYYSKEPARISFYNNPASSPQSTYPPGSLSRPSVIIDSHLWVGASDRPSIIEGRPYNNLKGGCSDCSDEHSATRNIQTRQSKRNPLTHSMDPTIRMGLLPLNVPAGAAAYRILGIRAH